MGFTTRRALAAIIVGLTSGVASAFVYAVVYAIVSLYLSGHSMTPWWFEPAANVLLFVVVGAVGLAAGTLAWRASGPRGTR